MKSVETTRIVDAPLERVFWAISEPENFQNSVPHITDIEFLSEMKSGVGTQFRETRVMKGKEHQVTLEITELRPNQSIRIVSDEGGTIWDSLFSVTSKDGQTELKLVMDVKPYKLMAKLFTPVIMGMVTQGVENDMDCIKAFCESNP